MLSRTTRWKTIPNDVKIAKAQKRLRTHVPQTPQGPVLVVVFFAIFSSFKCGRNSANLAPRKSPTGVHHVAIATRPLVTIAAILFEGGKSFSVTLKLLRFCKRGAKFVLFCFSERHMHARTGPNASPTYHRRSHRSSACGPLLYSHSTTWYKHGGGFSQVQSRLIQARIYRGDVKSAGRRKRSV